MIQKQRSLPLTVRSEEFTADLWLGKHTHQSRVFHTVPVYRTQDSSTLVCVHSFVETAMHRNIANVNTSMLYEIKKRRSFRTKIVHTEILVEHSHRLNSYLPARCGHSHFSKWAH